MKYIIFVGLLVYVEAVANLDELATEIGRANAKLEDYNGHIERKIRGLDKASEIVNTQIPLLQNSINNYIKALLAMTDEEATKTFSEKTVSMLEEQVQQAFSSKVDGFDEAQNLRNQFYRAAKTLISAPYTNARENIPKASGGAQDRIAAMTKQAGLIAEQAGKYLYTAVKKSIVVSTAESNLSLQLKM